MKSCFGISAAALALVIGMAAPPAQAQSGGYNRAPDREGDYDRPRRRDGYSERRPDGYSERRRDEGDGYDRRRSRDDDGGRDGRRGRDDDRRSRDSVVAQARGGFSQSCTGINQQGPFLEATCRTKRGDSVRSRIDVRSCGSIGNNDGRLVCE